METGRNRTETVRFPKRIGMIVPSSNTVVEPICSRIFFGMEDVVTVHYSRLEVVNVSLDDNSTRQFAVDTMLRAADQLAQAKVDAIIWNGTAGSWLGIERDREMCQKIEEKTKIPMSTASLGLVGSYQDFDIKRLHLVTPSPWPAPVLQHRRRPWRGDCSCLYEPGCCLESGLDRKTVRSGCV